MFKINKKTKISLSLLIAWLILFLSYSCVFYTPFTQAAGKSVLSDHGMTTLKLAPEAKMVYEQVIWIWIKDEFKQDISDEYLEITRKITYDECMRFEVIEGLNTYYVHIEFEAVYRDKTYNAEPRKVIKGQEILFVEKDNRVVQIQPFEEYTIIEVE